MTNDTLLVTGASGHLGRRVVELLLERTPAPRIIATTRNPASLADLAARGVDVRRADFDDPASLGPAFAGATRALVVSTDAVDDRGLAPGGSAAGSIDRPGRRVEQHRRAIAALVAAGVNHVVYTSLPNPVGSLSLIAADHAETEAALAATSINYTVLRNNLYADYLVSSLSAAVGSGQLIDAKGAAAVAYVTRDDCARAAAGALAGSHGGRTTVDVTGPAAITADELAAITSELTGVQVTHISVPVPALIEGMTGHGLPAPVAALLASFDSAATRGDYATTSTAVRDFGGVAPTSVRAFLTSQRAAFAPA